MSDKINETVAEGELLLRLQKIIAEYGRYDAIEVDDFTNHEITRKMNKLLSGKHSYSERWRSLDVIESNLARLVTLGFITCEYVQNAKTGELIDREYRMTAQGAERLNSEDKEVKNQPAKESSAFLPFDE